MDLMDSVTSQLIGKKKKGKDRVQNEVLLVLVVEISEINHQVFDDKHVGKRSDISGCRSVCINRLEACNCVGSIYVHRT